MFKKFFLMLLLLCIALPMTAGAATVKLATRVMTTGGSIQVGTLPAQTVANGTKYAFITTDTSVVVAAKPGYEITKVLLNGVDKGAVASPVTYTMGPSSADGGTLTNQGVVVYFAKQLTAVSTSASTGGSVSPSGINKLQAGANVTFTFIPNSGKRVVRIDGLAGLTYSVLDYDGVTPAIIPGAVDQKLKVVLTVPETPVTLTGYYVDMTASAGVPQTVLTGNPVTLAGSSTTEDGSAVTYAWTQIGGPGFVKSDPATRVFPDGTTGSPSFTAAVAGTYYFNMVATSAGGATATSSTKVLAAATAEDAAQAQCNFCHVQNNVGAQGDVFNKWAASLHSDEFVMCYSCHVGTNTGTHPGKAPSAATCYSCHGDAVVANAIHGVQNEVSCALCHTDPHGPAITDAPAPHGGGAVLVQAQFLSSTSKPIVCADCHGNNVANNSHILELFVESGHGDVNGEAWMHYDWRSGGNRIGCERCHTGSGYVAKLGNESSTASSFIASDAGKPGETLSCKTCHDTAADPSLTYGTLRAAGAYTNTYSNGATVAYPNVGASNLCVRCHSGRENGDSIKNFTGDFAAKSFINSHYLAAGSMVFSDGGYEYGATDLAMGFHQNVGVGNTVGTGEAGPCVACHMGIGTVNHTWEVVTKDAEGVITAINSNACASCHTLTAAALEEKKESFHVALEALNQALQAKGIYFAASYPYFFDAPTGGTGISDWTLGGTMDGEMVMGAAFNYNLMEHDPGAYAHNRGYALQLIADSIDFLADGVIDGVGSFAIIPEGGTEPVATDLVAPVVATSSASVVSTNCGSCHTSTYGEWTGSRHGNGNTSPYFRGATSNCSTCHAPGGEAMVTDPSTTTLAGVVGCQGCHGENSHPTTGFDAISSCVDCHNTGYHATSRVSQTFADKIAASVHGDAELTYGDREKCARCHTAQGSIEFAQYTGNAAALSALDSATGSYPAGVNNATCAACHDPHTASLREVQGWDPNNNGVADQFDLCTSCHTYYDQDGMIVGGASTTGAYAGTTSEYYHATSWYRTVTSTHYDNPATGVTGSDVVNGTNLIEGYVVRANSANPCFDCHGHELRTNTRYGDQPASATNADYGPTIHTDWASSAHAGGLLKAKRAAGALTYATGNETTDAVMNAGVEDAKTGDAWAHYNWDRSGRSSCQKCHTATGAANFLDATAAGTTYVAADNDFSHLAGWSDNTAAGSNQQEVLYCWGCHTSVETGALRATGAVTVDYLVNGVAQSVTPSDSKSTACLSCHSGRGNLNSLLGAATLDPAGAAISNPGTKSHYLAAGLTINQAVLNAGYTFGLNYTDKPYFAHNNLGCADCHMSSPNSHSFDVAAKNATGNITAIASTKCVECHDGEHALFVGASQLGTTQNIWDGAAAVPTVVTQTMVDAAAAELEHEAHGYHAALEALGLILDAAGTPRQAGYPYFSGTAANQGHAGAMYNYSYLHHEPGAYAHNRYLAKRLIWDSIDWMDNGVLDNSTATTVAANADALAWLGSVRP